jgi:hypothetical protein
MSVWVKGFIQLGDKYVNWYLNGQFELQWLADTKFHREAIMEVYSVLIKQSLTPIENLNEEQKMEIWADCKPFIKHLTTPDRIKFCKCYWALSWLAGKRV